MKNTILKKMAQVPFPFWILMIVIYFTPIILDDAPGDNELIWFVYTIPAFILSYYWGALGGIISAVISSFTEIIWEILLSHMDSGEYHRENIIVILATTLLSFGLAFGIGLLADRLKNNQKIIEIMNRELQDKNKQLDNMSHIDELTGLWNRRGLLKLAQYWVSRKQEQQIFSVLFIDLDNFKPVNDTYGHQVGDKLLQEVAKSLKKCISEDAVISRIGGDEYIILLPNADEGQAVKEAQNIISYLSNCLLIEGKEIFITSSIGISISSSGENDVEQLLQQADIAMYYVKRNGRNGYSVFAQFMKELSESRMQLENLLRKALEQEEFQLYYQPQFGAMTDQIVSFEALIRWCLNGKIIPPGEFISLAEETGLILPIGKWVLETACKQIKIWTDAGFNPLPVSVNVSSRQFQQNDFVFCVQSVLNETQIESHLLRLELTESVILGNEEVIINKLKMLKHLGISLSIDDFGSGYSSLTYLKDFPMDEIKMDKSFIDEIHYNLKDRSLVQSIINLGHSLDMKVVAEGVETQEQLNFLQEAGCDIIQGFLTGKPVPVSDIEKLFQEGLNSKVS